MFYPYISNDTLHLLPGYQTTLYLPHRLLGIHHNMPTIFGQYTFQVSETTIPWTYTKFIEELSILCRFQDSSRKNRSYVDPLSPETDFGIYFHEYYISLAALIELGLPLLSLLAAVWVTVVGIVHRKKKPSFDSLTISKKSIKAIVLILMILILQGGITNLCDLKFQLNEQGIINLDGWDPINLILLHGCYFLLFRLYIESVKIYNSHARKMKDPLKPILLHVIFLFSCYTWIIMELGVIAIPYSVYAVKLALLSWIVIEIEINIVIYNSHLIEVCRYNGTPEENEKLYD